MIETVSVFKGAKNPIPTESTDWLTVLENIKSDKYKSVIEKCRGFTDPVKYREFKTKLPAVTFCGEFKDNREKGNIQSTTGFIIPDIDHIDNVESVFNLLSQDENIWFAFRSPSGNGIKCGIRAKAIATDEDIKKLYAAIEHYFKSVYNIKIDPACKDISRLTFISHDPKLFINSDPYYFNIKKWTSNGLPEYILPENRNNGWQEKYGRKVIETACDEIRNSQPGEQHAIRLRKAYLIGGFIGSVVNESEALSALEQAVIDSGAKKVSEAMKTVRDGIASGKQSPITIEENPKYAKREENNDYWDVDKVDKVDGVDKRRHEGTDGDVGRQEVDKGDSPHPDTGPQNLAAHIREWITNSTGSFTTEQLDREFCLTSRNEKKNRSKCLTVYIENKLVRRDKRIKGKYHILDTQVEFVNLHAVEEKSFSIILPFNLHDYVKIPRKAMIVCAGSGNAGKTALALNILKLNLKQKYEKIYLFSEMGLSEYKSRIMSFKLPLSDWDCVKAADKSYGFDGVIEHHNQDGLTCIDFLEEIEGEYFKIASSIRDIYDSLGEGVVFLNIQKKKGSEFARGGEATQEKARLYMTLDFMALVGNDIICALKITKLKEWRNKNLLNHEIHFKLSNGCIIQPLNDWTLSRKIDRQKCIAEYESIRRKPLGDNDFTFMSKDGNQVCVREAAALNWADEFTNIDVQAELLRMSADSNKKPFLSESGYFFQISGILQKLNKKRLDK